MTEPARSLREHRVSTWVSIWLSPVRFYRRYLSPLKGRPSCRYLPTCSEYAIEAVESRGILVGTCKAVWRIVRCNPLFSGGYDPVDSEGSVCRHGSCED